jgi:REP element-mobilizing transposase RayT
MPCVKVESGSYGRWRNSSFAALERVRRSFELCVYGYVVMPEHVHLLRSEPRQHTLADAVKSLKQGVSRRLIGDAEHFWQKRYYDFNVRNERQFLEKLRYIHRNPMKHGLCVAASGGTAPLKPKDGLSGPPVEGVDRGWRLGVISGKSRAVPAFSPGPRCNPG